MSCRTPLSLFDPLSLERLYRQLGQRFAFIFALLLIITISPSQAALSDMSRIYRQTPSLQAFEICFGGGCAEIANVALSAEEWQKVVQLFETHQPNNAAQEREVIAQAIGLLETIVGEKTGTAGDIAGTFYNGGLSSQLDCNDEAINTTTYIRLMQQAHLIRLHEAEDTRTRNFFFTGWPHSTAVMHDIKTNERFAVDSWFYDNGAPATIVPFPTWKSGYRPADSPIGQARKTIVNTPTR